MILPKIARRPGLWLGLWLIVCFFSPVSTFSQDQDSADGKPSVGSFTIAGTVVNSVTGAPLPQARVAITNTRKAGRAEQLITSENGHFEFLNLPAGKFSLQGSKRGFLPGAYDQHEQFSTAIVTGPDFDTGQLVLRLTPMAIITGHILDEVGDPVRGAQVDLFREDHCGGMTRIARAAVSSHTDDQGFYDFTQLEPGTYFVSVTAEPWYAVHPVIVPDATGHTSSIALDVAYPTTYYSRATEADSATPIAVKGGDRPQIDIHLNPVPALHLLFQVPVDQTDQFRPPILQKHVFDAMEQVQTDGMRPVSRGVFEITGVPAGRYTVRTEGAGSGQAQQATDVDLTRDGQDLGSTSEPLATLKLVLRLFAGEQIPKQFAFALQDARHRTIAYQMVDAAGAAKFEGVAAGKYAILVYSPGQAFAVAQISTSAGDALGHELNVVAGTDQEVTVIVTGGIVSLEGTVKKGGKPAAGVMVALVPDDPEGHLELFRRDQSDFDGTFAVRGVIPGNYTIVAVEDAWGFEWLQPGVLTRYVQHGQRLTISNLMRGSVRLPDPVEVQTR